MNGTDHPYLSRKARREAEPETAAVEVEAPVVASSSRQAGVVAPDRVNALPRVVVHSSPTVWLIGLHGGAGVSSLAASIRGSREARQAWPAREDAAPVPALLVARTHAAGLQAAQWALTQWASGEAGAVELHGLVLVADAPGKRPRELRDQARLVAGGAPRTWEIDWHEPFRLAATPGSVPAPRAVTKLADFVASVSGGK